MAFTMGAVAAKDGAGTTIPGGLLAADTVGSNTGPWFLFNGIVDGVAGANRAQVTAGNALRVDGSGSVAHDAAGTTVNPTLVGGYASATAPTDVSADGDSVRAWRLRNGAAATVLTAAGALIGGDATNGLDVDVTRIIPGTSATHLGKAEDAAHASGDTGVMALAVRNDAGTALAGADGDYIPLSTDSSGALRVTGGGGGTQYTEDAAAAADPVGNMLMAVRRDTLSASEVSADGDNIALKATSKGKLHVAAELRAGDSPLSTGIGNSDSTTLRVVIANESQTGAVANNVDAVAESSTGTTTPVSSYLFGYNGATYDRLRVDASKNLKTVLESIVTDDAAFTPATTRVNMAGFQADESSTDSVDEGDAGAARMTLDRKVIVTVQPHSAGGKDTYRNVDLDEADQQIKGSAATLHGGWFTNEATTTRWIHFYDALAANVTVGTTTPKISVGVPGNTTDDTLASLLAGESGLAFSTALTIACTVNKDGTGAPSTGDLTANVFYK